MLETIPSPYIRYAGKSKPGSKVQRLFLGLPGRSLTGFCGHGEILSHEDGLFLTDQDEEIFSAVR